MTTTSLKATSTTDQRGLDHMVHAYVERIRELEAVAEHNAQIGAEMTREAHRQEARAEKAEREVIHWHDLWVKEKARVAELVRMVEMPCPFCGSGANETYRAAVLREKEEC